MDLTAAMVDAAGSLLCVVDLESGTLRAANGAVERLTGLASHELAGRPFVELVELPVERPDLREAFSSSTDLRIPLAFAAPLRTRSGEVRHVVWSGGFLADGAEGGRQLVLTGIDEPEGWAGAGLLSHLMRAATATALVGTDLDGRITFFSAGAEALLGYSAPEMIGRTIPAEIFISPGLLETRVEDWIARQETRDWDMVTKDGSRLTASVTVSPLADATGHHIGFLGIAQDVTDQRRREALLLEDLERERLAVERLASAHRQKDGLITTVSHEFRTPLTSIAGCAELLAHGDGGALTPEQAKLIGVIRRNAERLEALIQQVITWLDSQGRRQTRGQGS